MRFSFAQDPAEKLYSISPPRAYKNFYNIFFTVYPLSLLWLHSFIVSTTFPLCLIRISLYKKIMLCTALKRAVISTIKYCLENSLK